MIAGLLLLLVIVLSFMQSWPATQPSNVGGHDWTEEPFWQCVIFEECDK